jgi:hypothetical protein
MPPGDPIVAKVKVLLQDRRLEVTGREVHNGRDANVATRVVRWRTYEVLPGAGADRLLTLNAHTRWPTWYTTASPGRRAAARTPRPRRGRMPQAIPERFERGTGIRA